MKGGFVTLFLVLVVTLGPVAGSRFQEHLNSRRATLGLTRETPLENAPPVLAFTTVAFGGFRGLLANILWARAVKLQDQEKYLELVNLADWITKLQPDFSTVWCIQAWNMTYGVSRQFSAPLDRWSWVNSGIELLRDQALKYNPREPEIYRELAWFYLDKLGKVTDEAHAFYKEALATDMVQILGRQPRYDDLIQPATDDARKRAEILKTIYKLDPAWMQEVDKRYGPLDWRVPETHGIYWASYGLEKGRQEETIRLRRLIWQGVDGAFKRGRLIENRVDRKLEFGPNLAMVDNAYRVFEEMRKAEPGQEHVVIRAEKQFLLTAVYFLYTHNRIAEAARWFNLVQTEFPGTVPQGMDLDSFVVSTVAEKIEKGKPTQVQILLEGFITRQYLSLALGEEDEAMGYALLARRAHAHFQQRYADTPHLLLPPLDQMARKVVDSFGQPGSAISPAMAERLRGLRDPKSEAPATAPAPTP